MNDEGADAAVGPDAPPAPDAAAPAAAAPDAAPAAAAAAAPAPAPAVGKAKKPRRADVTTTEKALLNEYFAKVQAEKWTDPQRVQMVKGLLTREEFQRLDVPCITRIYNLYVKTVAMSREIASLMADGIADMTNDHDRHGLSFDAIVGLLTDVGKHFDAGRPNGLPKPLRDFLEMCTDAHIAAAQGRGGGGGDDWSDNAKRAVQSIRYFTHYVLIPHYRDFFYLLADVESGALKIAGAPDKYTLLIASMEQTLLHSRQDYVGDINSDWRVQFSKSALGRLCVESDGTPRYPRMTTAATHG